MKPTLFQVNNTRENVKYGKITLLAMIFIEIIMLLSTFIFASSFGAYINTYRLLYVSFACACLVTFFILQQYQKNLEKNQFRITFVLGLFAVFIAQWAIGITIVDYYHMNSLNETVLITCIFWVMIVFTFHPLFSMSLMLIIVAIYGIEINSLCHLNHSVLLSSIVNLLILSVLACFVSVIRYWNAKKQFNFQNVILNQNIALSKANIEVLKVKSQIEETNYEKTQFLINMAHEFRIPIHTILENEQELSKKNLPDYLKMYHEKINRAGKELLTYVNEVMNFTRIDSGAIPVNDRKYSIQDMVSKEVQVAAQRASGKDITIETNFDSSIPEYLLGDDVKLSQIICNLLLNAVKYTQEGNVEISVSCPKKTEQSIDLKIQVTDTGIGIREENMKELFQYHVKEPLQDSEDNTGIGLCLTKKYMDLMNGKIRVNSTYLQGTTFTITLKQKIWNQKKELGLSKEFETGCFEAPGARILVVDDNEMNLAVVKGLLKKTKMKIDTCTSGKEALEKSELKDYHVILLDYLIPEMNGIEVLDQIRRQANGRNRMTPVIAVTANTGFGMQKKYMETGFNGYLAKPIIGRDLEQMIFKCLPKEICHNTKKQQYNELGTLANIEQQAEKQVDDIEDVILDLEAFELETAIQKCQKLKLKYRDETNQNHLKQALEWMKQLEYENAMKELRKVLP